MDIESKATLDEVVGQLTAALDRNTHQLATMLDALLEFAKKLKIQITVMPQ